MATKKVYRLKKKVKILLVISFIFLIILGISIYAGISIYKDNLYHNSYEYKLLELGYEDNQVKALINNLKENELDEIMKKYKYDEFIPEFVKCKYFKYDNLSEYLTMVIYQKDDFFKYHGIDGYDFDNLVSIVNSHANLDPYENDMDAQISKNNSILVNKYYKLTKEYVPDDLVDIELKYYYGSKKQIKREVYDAFLKMFEDAKKDDFYLLILGAYRSYDVQEFLYNKIAKSLGISAADRQSARPGYSEHQTGLALDIYSKECTDSKTFANSKTYTWLINNAHKYGFILRYPEDKKKITGFAFEPYHFRYVGVDLALKIKESNLTLEEYYAYYLK